MQSDVFLICINAMQYNAPETIYFKQARSIQELARKKFQRLRAEIERAETVLKSEQKTKSNSVVRSVIKKSPCRTPQEPVGSDFSSGANLATVRDTCTLSNTAQAGACEKPNVDGLLDGNYSVPDNKHEKADEQVSDITMKGKGLPSKFGNKQFLLYENRRATYDISSQPLVNTESIFTTFDGENKKLVDVGLSVDHSYATSLARFASTLGPVAWKVASQRIKQALPVGFKFGRGWVGEYEPLSTPVVMLENLRQKQPIYGANLHCEVELRKDDKTAQKAVPHDFKQDSRNLNSTAMPASIKNQIAPINGVTVEGKPGLFCVAGTKPNVTAKPDSNRSKQVEMNLSSSNSENPIDITLKKQLEHCSELPNSKSIEMVSRNSNLMHPVPFRKPETDGVTAEGLPNGKTHISLDGNRVSISSTDQKGGRISYFPGVNQEGLTDPVQLMKMLAERMPSQKTSSNNPTICTPRVMPSVPSSRRDDSSTATAAAARAWMSVGATRFNPTNISSPPHMEIARELPPSVSRFHREPPVSGGLNLLSENRFAPREFFSRPVSVEEAKWRQSNNKSMVFPQLATTDFSRVQMQPTWRGFTPCTQQISKQDMRPPDLNIGFQSSESPARQSSGILVDSQQPDLALQL